MTESFLNTFELKHELLDSVSDARDATPTFEACLNAHGMYETMRFVLRLSSRNHQREYPRLCVWGLTHAAFTGHQLSRSGYRILPLPKPLNSFNLNVS